MHDGIYEHQSRLSEESLVKLAERNGLDRAAFAEAVNSRAFEERVKADFLSGVRSGVNGTPTFFINGHRHDAAPDFESLSAAIEAAPA